MREEDVKEDVREEDGWKDKSSHLVTSVKVIMTLYIVFTLTKYIL